MPDVVLRPPVGGINRSDPADMLREDECTDAFMLLCTRAGLKVPGTLKSFAGVPDTVPGTLGASGVFWLQTPSGERQLFSLWRSTDWNQQGSDYRPMLLGGLGWTDPWQAQDENWLAQAGRISCVEFSQMNGKPDMAVVCVEGQRPYLLEKVGSTWRLHPAGRLRPTLGLQGVAPTGVATVAGGQVTGVTLLTAGGRLALPPIARFTGGSPGTAAAAKSATCGIDDVNADSTMVLWAGTGYLASHTYANVVIKNGVGGADQGGRATLVTNAAGQVVSVTVTAAGSGYTVAGVIDGSFAANSSPCDIRFLLKAVSVGGLPDGVGYTTAPAVTFFVDGEWDTGTRVFNAVGAGQLVGEYQYAFSYMDVAADGSVKYESALSEPTNPIYVDYQDVRLNRVPPHGRVDTVSSKAWVNGQNDGDVNPRAKWVGVYRRGGSSGSWQRVTVLGPSLECQGYNKFSQTGAVADATKWYVKAPASVNMVGMSVCYSLKYKNSMAFPLSPEAYFIGQVTAQGAHDGTGREVTCAMPFYKAVGNSASNCYLNIFQADFTDSVKEAALGPLAPEGHELPPPAKHVAYWNRSVWYANTAEAPGQILRANVDHPGYTARGQTSLYETGGLELYTDEGPTAKITALVAVRGGLAVFTERALHVITGTRNSNFRVERVSGWGCTSDACAFPLDDGVVWMSREGPKFWRLGAADVDLGLTTRDVWTANGGKCDHLFIAGRHLWVVLGSDCWAKSLDASEAWRGWTHVNFNGTIDSFCPAPVGDTAEWYAGIGFTSIAGVAEPGVVKFPDYSSAHFYAYGDGGARMTRKAMDFRAPEREKIVLRMGAEVLVPTGLSQTGRIRLVDNETGGELFASGDLIWTPSNPYLLAGVRKGGRKLQPQVTLDYPVPGTVLGSVTMSVSERGRSR